MSEDARPDDIPEKLAADMFELAVRLQLLAEHEKDNHQKSLTLQKHAVDGFLKHETYLQAGTEAGIGKEFLLKAKEHLMPAAEVSLKLHEQLGIIKSDIYYANLTKKIADMLIKQITNDLAPYPGKTFVRYGPESLLIISKITETEKKGFFGKKNKQETVLATIDIKRRHFNISVKSLLFLQACEKTLTSLNEIKEIWVKIYSDVHPD